MTATPSIDVVIPTFGGWSLTESCLRHLGRQTMAHRVIVVDNASPDGTPARLAAGFPQVTVVAMDANRGYAAACNRGIAAGNGEIVVLLNNDVDCAPDFLERACARFAQDERLGGVAPLLLRPGGATIDCVGLTADVTLAGFPRLQGRPARDAAAARPGLVGPAGAAAVYRRRTLADVGWLDEGFFMYQEDLDLALRVGLADWGAAIAPQAVAVHRGSATAGRRSTWQRRRAGFARGYLLRRYGVTRSRHVVRALLTEAIAVAGDAVLARDLAALRGRLEGWQAARAMPRLRADGALVDRGLTFLEALRLRYADYAVSRVP